MRRERLKKQENAEQRLKRMRRVPVCIGAGFPQTDLELVKLES